MGLVITSGNLNNMGDNGNFETDPSTWGVIFFNAAYLTYDRLSGVAQLGSNCLDGVNTLADWDAGKIKGVICRVPVNTFAINQLFVVKAWVRIPSGNPVASATAVISLAWSALGGEGATIEEYASYKVTNIISNATDTWVEIQTVFKLLNPSGPAYRFIDIKFTQSGATLNQYGEFYVDNVRIFKCEDVEDPQPSIDIDVPNCVITDESAPGANDGSITIAVTEANTTQPKSYSKDNGANWQASNQFTGLAPGVYICKVKDSSAPPAEASQSFSINEAAPDFDFTTDITHESISGSNDGQIEVTVTGTGGPFTFSKDGGTNYQASNIFSGLAPGTYTIVVKDAGDNIVAHNATVNPGVADFENISFDRDPIPFELPETANSGEDNYKIMIDVKVEDTAASGIYVSKMTAAVPPDANGLCKFNLRQAFRGVLAADPPDQGDAVIRKLTDRVKLYKVFFGDIFDDMIEPAAWSSTLPKLVLMGGLAKRSFPVVDFFLDFIPDNKKFMTWAPAKKEVDALQEDYVNFWIYASAITEINLNVKAYFDDDTNSTSVTKTLTGTTYGELYQLPAGPVNSGATSINPAKNLIRYEIWITDQADAVISEVRTYVITTFRNPRTRYVMLLNSLGTYEVLRMIGQNEETAGFERKILEKHLPMDYSYLDGQFEGANVSKILRTSYSTGMMNNTFGSEWLEYLQEVLMSSRVFDITDGTRIPMIIQTNTMLVRKDSDNRKFLRFEATEAYSDHSFTPRVI